MSAEGVKAVKAAIRLAINRGVANGDIQPEEALAAIMSVVVTMIAQVRDPAQRAEFVVTLVQALPQMVEVVHVSGDPRVIEAGFGVRQ